MVTNILLWWVSFLPNPGQEVFINSHFKDVLITILLCVATLWAGIGIFCQDRSRKRGRKSTSKSSLLSTNLLIKIFILAVLFMITKELFILVVVLPVLIVSQFRVPTDYSSFKQFLWKLLIFSIPWEWLRLYKHQVALQFHQITKVNIIRVSMRALGFFVVTFYYLVKDRTQAYFNLWDSFTKIIMPRQHNSAMLALVSKLSINICD